MLSPERLTACWPALADDDVKWLLRMCWKASRKVRNQMFHGGGTGCEAQSCERCADFHLDHVEKVARATERARARRPEGFAAGVYAAKAARLKVHDVPRDRRTRAGLLAKPEALPNFVTAALEDSLQPLLVDMLFYVAGDDPPEAEDPWPVGRWASKHGVTEDGPSPAKVRRSIEAVLARLGSVRPTWVADNLVDPLERKLVCSTEALDPTEPLPSAAWAPSAEECALAAIEGVVDRIEPVLVRLLAGGAGPAAALASGIAELWGTAASDRARASADWLPLVQWAAGVAEALQRLGDQGRDRGPSVVAEGATRPAGQEKAA